MIVDLITLGNAPSDFEFSLAPEKIDLESEEAKLKKSVNVKGRITKHIVQTDVEGLISTGIEIDCTRCLQPLEQKIEISFEAAFVTAENFTQAKEAELGAQDLDVAVFDGQMIDLAELAREQILLNLPEQVFCKEDCKGLCEKCGANRNLIDCKCIEKEIDPRWQGLRELKIKNEK